MGKTTGFLEYAREEIPQRPVEERIHDWREVIKDPPIEKVRNQAARCMDCGIPESQREAVNRIALGRRSAGDPAQHRRQAPIQRRHPGTAPEQRELAEHVLEGCRLAAVDGEEVHVSPDAVEPGPNLRTPEQLALERLELRAPDTAKLEGRAVAKHGTRRLEQPFRQASLPVARDHLAVSCRAMRSACPVAPRSV